MLIVMYWNMRIKYQRYNDILYVYYGLTTLVN